MEQNKTIPTKTGVVVSISGKNTISVQIETRIKHFTGKVIKSFNKFLVHDAESKAKVGDVVQIKEGRKVSKRKAWHLDKIITDLGA